jgi:hypothetical protein
MEGTGRFTTAAFEHQKLPRHRSSSSSSSSTPSPKGIILKPRIVIQKPSSVKEELNQHSDRDVDSSLSSRSKRRQSNEHDDALLLSTTAGEKIYSTDFEESKSKLRNISNSDDDDDDDDIADTMKLSARSVTTVQHVYSDSDDD